MDLRHALLFAINILKSQVGSAWDWEPFDTIGHPTWIKSFTLAILLLIFPFTCIQVPLRLDSGHIIVRFGKLDPCFTVLFLASIVFPQALFWYAYPIIINIMISFCYSWLLNVLGSFLFWLQNVLTSIPVIYIIIRATITRWHNLHEVEAVERYQQSQEPGSDAGALDDAIQVIVDSPLPV